MDDLAEFTAEHNVAATRLNKIGLGAGFPRARELRVRCVRGGGEGPGTSI